MGDYTFFSLPIRKVEMRRCKKNCRFTQYKSKKAGNKKITWIIKKYFYCSIVQ